MGKTVRPHDVLMSAAGEGHDPEAVTLAILHALEGSSGNPRPPSAA